MVNKRNFSIFNPILFACLIFVSCTHSSQKQKAELIRIDSLLNAYKSNNSNALAPAIDSIINLKKYIEPTQLAKAYYLKAKRIVNASPDHILMSSLYCDSALLLLNSPSLRKSNAGLYYDLLIKKGDNAKIAKKNRDAYYSFLRGKELGIELKDKCKESTFDFRIALALYAQNNYSKAIQFFKSGLDNLAYCDHTFPFRFSYVQHLNNLGLCYVNLNEFDSAFSAFTNSLKRLEGIKDSFPESEHACLTISGIVYGNLAKCYYAQGDPEKAIQLLDTNIAINTLPGGDYCDAITSITFKIKILLDMNRVREIPELIHKGNSLLTHVYIPDYKLKFELVKWRYFQTVKDISKAAASANRYIHFIDSLHHSDKTSMLADIESSLGKMEEDKKMLELSRESQEKHYYVLLLCCFLIMFIVISAFLAYIITKTKSTNQKLHQLNTQIHSQIIELKKSDAEKDRIMAVVAHDLRSPITSVYSINKIILNSNPNLDQSNKEALQMISNACKSSLDLIDELLFFTAINKKRNELHLQRIKVNGFVHSIVGLLQFRANEKKQTIVFIALEEDSDILIDVGKMSRALSNIITNAIKFSKENTSISISAIRVNQYVKIEIKDQGIGIPSDMLPKVFDMFTEARRRGTAGENPFGLGLSISRQIIEQHKGRIWVESVVDKGSSFYIELPLVSNASAV